MRIEQGMRAARGAIQAIELKDDVVYHVIGGCRPVGLCGSALIDIAAELLRHDLLMPQGLLYKDENAPLPESISNRFRDDGNGPYFVVAEADETETGKPVCLTQKDIRELQLAVGAIRAGINTLLAKAGINVLELEQLFVAGGFGNFIRAHNAQRIGLLPAGFPRERIVFLGNTALAGAHLAACSMKAREKAQVISHRARHIDLSTDPLFKEYFMDAMFFPMDGE